jgi:hypothetical protein
VFIGLSAPSPALFSLFLNPFVHRRFTWAGGAQKQPETAPKNRKNRNKNPKKEPEKNPEKEQTKSRTGTSPKKPKNEPKNAKTANLKH